MAKTIAPWRLQPGEKTDSQRKSARSKGVYFEPSNDMSHGYQPLSHSS